MAARACVAVIRVRPGCGSATHQTTTLRFPQPPNLGTLSPKPSGIADTASTQKTGVWFASPTASLFSLAFPFKGPCEKENVPSFWGRWAIGQVWPRWREAPSARGTGHDGTSAGVQFLNPARTVLGLVPTWKYISPTTGASLQRPHSSACPSICRYSRPLSKFSVSLYLHVEDQRGRAHSRPVPASVSA